MNDDIQLRLAVFDWLEQQVEIHGDVLPRQILASGVIYQNHRIPLVSPKGIFKPQIMDLPLSITSTPNSSYDDALDKKGFLLYKYRGEDINHPDNRGLRTIMQNGIPLVYLQGLVPGKYLPVWPVYIIGDDPKHLTFTVAVDDIAAIKTPSPAVHEDNSARRAYITSIVRTRLHQRSFRERVLQAYKTQCAFCRLKYQELLDAAHIIPDTEPDSRPTVDNGIALCKIHHAAFDKYFLGITPDYIIEVRQDVLDQEDGPMLLHGIKEFHRTKLILPNSIELRPNQDFLARRYQKFRDAG